MLGAGHARLLLPRLAEASVQDRVMAYVMYNLSVAQVATL